MRTDSLRIAAEAQAAAKTFIAERWGDNYVCKTARKWKSRSATAAQDAHEAIRPSMPELTPDEVEQSISGDTAKLYRLIWSRFMASQMADCIQDTVSASITAGDYLFRASGFRVSFDGFTALYEESTDDAKKKETALPPLEEGQTLKLKKLNGGPEVHPAAAALHRGHADPRAGGKRHRTPVHLCAHHHDHRGPRLCGEGPEEAENHPARPGRQHGHDGAVPRHRQREIQR